MQLLRFVAGLVIALVFAAASLTAIGGVYTFTRAVIASGGDAGDLEAELRHYTDRLDAEADGTLRLVRAPYPIATFAALTIGSCAVAAAALVALRRLAVTV